jgi:hypothetical protein
MELFIAVLILAIVSVLAQAGIDSRDADPRGTQPAW